MKAFNRITDLISSIIHILVSLLIFVPFFVLSTTSFVSSALMTRENAVGELIVFVFDDILLNIAYAVIIIFCILTVAYLIRRMSIRSIKLYLAISVFWLSVIWIATSLSSPTWDSLFVTEAGYEVSNGSFDYLNQDYFRQYPFQLGYVFYNEIISYIFDFGGNFLIMEFFNAFELAVTYYLLINIVGMLTHSERAQRITAVIMILAPQPIIFTTFTYGIIPGLMFAVLSVYFILKYYSSDKPLFAVLASISSGIACMLKMNYLIATVAVCAVIILKLFNARKLKRILIELGSVALAVILSFALRNAAVIQYELRSGIDFGDGVPMSGWLAMGLGESSRAPGWYNPKYTVSTFSSSGNDTKKTDEIAREAIAERLKFFSQDTAYKNEFFMKKFLSQWNETTYQSIWNNNVRGQYGEKVFPAKYFCTEGQKSLVAYCDYYSQVIFAFSSICLIAIIRRRKNEELIIPVIIFGGMLYHLFFEAKSQYAMPYFILMLPLAAMGVDYLICIVKAKFDRKKESQEDSIPDSNYEFVENSETSN